ncbi:MAG: hypothetical protein F6K18_08405 [Okeania sp. SIO2C2]|uniref:hypothetical protein n=1 Tax=Okeania sp. SIO2C2 TaxID=2607787 RepID=UPI0013BB887D|nr:hypothetical protein [Okeania sp. SIO2C2]NEP78879.1 hypothetical protein [Okeania sp. SIO3B3]NEP86851.1 hypothetical protein [Okeania sp. SIO2C2]NER05165.1 hypothetical protein [Okeania sp. SIO3C4]
MPLPITVSTNLIALELVANISVVSVCSQRLGFNLKIDDRIKGKMPVPFLPSWV